MGVVVHVEFRDRVELAREGAMDAWRRYGEIDYAIDPSEWNKRLSEALRATRRYADDSGQSVAQVWGFG